MLPSWSTSNSVSKTQAGKNAEDFVTNELIFQGFEVLHRNWRTPYGEVDLVARNHNVLWIFEIKGRRESQIRRFPSLSHKQQLRLKNAALWIWTQYRKKYERFKCRLVVVTERGTKMHKLPLLYDQA